MAIRTNKLEYPLEQSITSLALATRLDFAAITLSIPEINSRTFRSAAIEVCTSDNVAAATALTSWLIGIKLGAVAFDDGSVTDTFTTGGENVAYNFIRDVTAYFNANFGSGASQTCQVGVNFGGVATINTSIKLVITYEYDDTAQDTRAKTVKIPFDSPAAAMASTTLTEIGTNQVPALDTFLPEASKVYRSIWFEVHLRPALSNATSGQVGLSLDAEAAVNDGVHQGALGSTKWYRRIWRRNDMATNAAHAFKLKTNNALAVMSNVTVVLCVTYEYSHTSSTTILNSLELPFIEGGVFGGSNVAADKSRSLWSFFIEEPDTITLKQSGIILTFSESSGMTLQLAAGAQTARAYVITTGATECGGFVLGHRVDALGASGAGLTLARGENTLTFDYYSSAGGQGSNIGGALILNYTSGKHALGAGAHNHTISWPLADSAGDTTRRVFTAIAPQIPETSFWIQNVGWVLLAVYPAEPGGALALNAEVLSGEDEGDGWKPIYQGGFRQDAEISAVSAYVHARGQFKKYPNDPSSERLDLEVARSFRLDANPAIWMGMYFLITYHSIKSLISGAVTGYTGDGSGLTVDIFRSSNDLRVLSLTTTVGGAFSNDWYDNTLELYAVVRQDGTHLGRSDDTLAVLA